MGRFPMTKKSITALKSNAVRCAKSASITRLAPKTKNVAVAVLIAIRMGARQYANQMSIACLGQLALPVKKQMEKDYVSNARRLKRRTIVNHPNASGQKTKMTRVKRTKQIRRKATKPIRTKQI